MAANTTPIFTLSPRIGQAMTATTGKGALFSNTYTGTNSIPVLNAGINGSRISRIIASSVTASTAQIIRLYTVTPLSAAQTITPVADVSGNLNNTYFLLDAANNTVRYYVWFNINSAGVDPAVPGRTGIAVTGATNVSAATLGAAIVSAVTAAGPGTYFTASGTTTVTINQKVSGPYNLAADSMPNAVGGGGSPTGFTFTSAGANYTLWNEVVIPSTANSATVAASSVVLQPDFGLILPFGTSLYAQSTVTGLAIAVTAEAGDY